MKNKKTNKIEEIKKVYESLRTSNKELREWTDSPLAIYPEVIDFMLIRNKVKMDIKDILLYAQEDDEEDCDEYKKVMFYSYVLYSIDAVTASKLLPLYETRKGMLSKEIIFKASDIHKGICNYFGFPTETIKIIVDEGLAQVYSEAAKSSE